MKKVKNMTDLKFQIVYTPANYTNFPGRESPGAHSKLSPVGGGHQPGRPALGGVPTAHMKQSGATTNTPPWRRRIAAIAARKVLSP